ncbi:Hypothetical Protein FCC1311_017542 [Hondaea fermentalgiana]|uniref:Uncharacterized protein n=1 Tax=Hondaea fermentalgiana TaxID=2315210 RepID=A0A2R5G4P6_9STRA|nr:Hypothetical Protein FCC1311_017542 [Hondaea fermentalgiana]|eukprot:GBG25535.1 Hypothetical Protein FCC1311_017542 [Hondaea fermentalgiana]
MRTRTSLHEQKNAHEQSIRKTDRAKTQGIRIFSIPTVGLIIAVLAVIATSASGLSVRIPGQDNALQTNTNTELLMTDIAIERHIEDEAAPWEPLAKVQLSSENGGSFLLRCRDHIIPTTNISTFAALAKWNRNISFAGKVDNINAALHCLFYRSANDFSGNETVHIAVELADAQHTAHVPIRVAPADELSRPHLNLAIARLSAGITEDSSDAFPLGERLGSRIVDPLQASLGIEISSIANAVLDMPGYARTGLTAAQAQAALDALTYLPPVNFFGQDVVSIRVVNEDTNASDAKHLIVDVRAENDAPTLSLGDAIRNMTLRAGVATPLRTLPDNQAGVVIADIDATPGERFRCGIRAPPGVLHIARHAGVHVSTTANVMGTSDVETILQGTLPALHAALRNIVLAPSSDAELTMWFWVMDASDLRSEIHKLTLQVQSAPLQALFERPAQAPITFDISQGTSFNLSALEVVLSDNSDSVHAERDITTVISLALTIDPAAGFIDTISGEQLPYWVARQGLGTAQIHLQGSPAELSTALTRLELKVDDAWESSTQMRAIAVVVHLVQQPFESSRVTISVRVNSADFALGFVLGSTNPLKVRTADESGEQSALRFTPDVLRLENLVPQAETPSIGSQAYTLWVQARIGSFALAEQVHRDVTAIFSDQGRSLVLKSVDLSKLRTTLSQVIYTPFPATQGLEVILVELHVVQSGRTTSSRACEAFINIEVGRGDTTFEIGWIPSNPQQLSLLTRESPEAPRVYEASLQGIDFRTSKSHADPLLIEISPASESILLANFHIQPDAQLGLSLLSPSIVHGPLDEFLLAVRRGLLRTRMTVAAESTAAQSQLLGILLTVGDLSGSELSLRNASIEDVKSLIENNRLAEPYSLSFTTQGAPQSDALLREVELLVGGSAYPFPNLLANPVLANDEHVAQGLELPSFKIQSWSASEVLSLQLQTAHGLLRVGGDQSAQEVESFETVASLNAWLAQGLRYFPTRGIAGVDHVSCAIHGKDRRLLYSTQIAIFVGDGPRGLSPEESPLADSATLEVARDTLVVDAALNDAQPIILDLQTHIAQGTPRALYELEVRPTAGMVIFAETQGLAMSAGGAILQGQRDKLNAALASATFAPDHGLDKMVCNLEILLRRPANPTFVVSRTILLSVQRQTQIARDSQLRANNAGGATALGVLRRNPDQDSTMLRVEEGQHFEISGLGWTYTFEQDIAQLPVIVHVSTSQGRLLLRNPLDALKHQILSQADDAIIMRQVAQDIPHLLHQLEVQLPEHWNSMSAGDACLVEIALLQSIDALDEVTPLIVPVHVQPPLQRPSITGILALEAGAAGLSLSPLFFEGWTGFASAKAVDLELGSVAGGQILVPDGLGLANLQSANAVHEAFVQITATLEPASGELRFRVKIYEHATDNILCERSFWIARQERVKSARIASEVQVIHANQNQSLRLGSLAVNFANFDQEACELLAIAHHGTLTIVPSQAATSQLRCSHNGTAQVHCLGTPESLASVVASGLHYRSKASFNGIDTLALHIKLKSADPEDYLTEVSLPVIVHATASQIELSIEAISASTILSALEISASNNLDFSPAISVPILLQGLNARSHDAHIRLRSDGGLRGSWQITHPAFQTLQVKTDGDDRVLELRGALRKLQKALEHHIQFTLMTPLDTRTTAQSTELIVEAWIDSDDEALQGASAPHAADRRVLQLPLTSENGQLQLPQSGCFVQFESGCQTLRFLRRASLSRTGLRLGWHDNWFSPPTRTSAVISVAASGAVRLTVPKDAAIDANVTWSLSSTGQKLDIIAASLENAERWLHNVFVEDEPIEARVSSTEGQALRISVHPSVTVRLGIFANQSDSQEIHIRASSESVLNDALANLVLSRGGDTPWDGDATLTLQIDDQVFENVVHVHVEAPNPTFWEVSGSYRRGILHGPTVARNARMSMSWQHGEPLSFDGLRIGSAMSSGTAGLRSIRVEATNGHGLWLDDALSQLTTSVITNPADLQRTTLVILEPQGGADTGLRESQLLETVCDAKPEIHSISIVDSTTSDPISGSFRVSWRGITSNDIAHNASSSEIQAELEAIVDVGALTVTREVNSNSSASEAYTWLVTFSELSSGPTGVVFGIEDAMFSSASTAVFSQLERAGNVIGGAFRLGFFGRWTSLLSWNVDPSELEHSLIGLAPTLLESGVHVTLESEGSWSTRSYRVTFDMMGQFPLIEPDTTMLTGDGASMTVTRDTAGVNASWAIFRFHHQGLSSRLVSSRSALTHVSRALQDVGLVLEPQVSENLWVGRHPNGDSGDGFLWVISATIASGLRVEAVEITGTLWASSTTRAMTLQARSDTSMDNILSALRLYPNVARVPGRSQLSFTVLKAVNTLLQSETDSLRINFLSSSTTGDQAASSAGQCTLDVAASTVAVDGFTRTHGQLFQAAVPRIDCLGPVQQLELRMVAYQGLLSLSAKAPVVAVKGARGLVQEKRWSSDETAGIGVSEIIVRGSQDAIQEAMNSAAYVFGSWKELHLDQAQAQITSLRISRHLRHPTPSVFVVETRCNVGVISGSFVLAIEIAQVDSEGRVTSHTTDVTASIDVQASFEDMENHLLAVSTWPEGEAIQVKRSSETNAQLTYTWEVTVVHSIASQGHVLSIAVDSSSLSSSSVQASTSVAAETITSAFSADLSSVTISCLNGDAVFTADASAEEVQAAFASPIIVSRGSDGSLLLGSSLIGGALPPMNCESNDPHVWVWESIAQASEPTFTDAVVLEIRNPLTNETRASNMISVRGEATVEQVLRRTMHLARPSKVLHCIAGDEAVQVSGFFLAIATLEQSPSLNLPLRCAVRAERGTAYFRLPEGNTQDVVFDRDLESLQNLIHSGIKYTPPTTGSASDSIQLSCHIEWKGMMRSSIVESDETILLSSAEIIVHDERRTSARISGPESISLQRGELWGFDGRLQLETDEENSNVSVDVRLTTQIGAFVGLSSDSDSRIAQDVHTETYADESSVRIVGLSSDVAAVLSSMSYFASADSDESANVIEVMMDGRVQAQIAITVASQYLPLLVAECSQANGCLVEIEEDSTVLIAQLAGVHISPMALSHCSSESVSFQVASDSGRLFAGHVSPDLAFRGGLDPLEWSTRAELNALETALSRLLYSSSHKWYGHDIVSIDYTCGDFRTRIEIHVHVLPVDDRLTIEAATSGPLYAALDVPLLVHHYRIVDPDELAGSSQDCVPLILTLMTQMGHLHVEELFGAALETGNVFLPGYDGNRVLAFRACASKLNLLLQSIQYTRMRKHKANTAIADTLSIYVRRAHEAEEAHVSAHTQIELERQPGDDLPALVRKTNADQDGDRVDAPVPLHLNKQVRLSDLISLEGGDFSNASPGSSALLTITTQYGSIRSETLLDELETAHVVFRADQRLVIQVESDSINLQNVLSLVWYASLPPADALRWHAQLLSTDRKNDVISVDLVATSYAHDSEETSELLPHVDVPLLISIPEELILPEIELFQNITSHALRLRDARPIWLSDQADEDTQSVVIADAELVVLQILLSESSAPCILRDIMLEAHVPLTRAQVVGPVPLDFFLRDRVAGRTSTAAISLTVQVVAGSGVLEPPSRNDPSIDVQRLATDWFIVRGLVEDVDRVLQETQVLSNRPHEFGADRAFAFAEVYVSVVAKACGTTKLEARKVFVFPEETNKVAGVLEAHIFSSQGQEHLEAKASMMITDKVDVRVASGATDTEDLELVISCESGRFSIEGLCSAAVNIQGLRSNRILLSLPAGHPIQLAHCVSKVKYTAGTDSDTISAFVNGKDESLFAISVEIVTAEPVWSLSGLGAESNAATLTAASLSSGSIDLSAAFGHFALTRDRGEPTSALMSVTFAAARNSARVLWNNQSEIHGVVATETIDGGVLIQGSQPQVIQALATHAPLFYEPPQSSWCGRERIRVNVDGVSVRALQLEILCEGPESRPTWSDQVSLAIHGFEDRKLDFGVASGLQVVDTASQLHGCNNEAWLVRVQLSTIDGLSTQFTMPKSVPGVRSELGESADFVGCVSDVNAALRALVIAPETDTFGNASLQCSVSRLASTDEDRVELRIEFEAVHDGPRIRHILPNHTLQVMEGETLVLGGFYIQDADAASSSQDAYEVTLRVPTGTIYAGSPAEERNIRITRSDSGDVILRGLLSELNLELKRVLYTASSRFTGTLNLEASVQDKHEHRSVSTISVTVAGVGPGISLRRLQADVLTSAPTLVPSSSVSLAGVVALEDDLRAPEFAQLTVTADPAGAQPEVQQIVVRRPVFSDVHLVRLAATQNEAAAPATFKLSYDGETTGDIDRAALDSVSKELGSSLGASMESMLAALGTVDQVEVSRTKLGAYGLEWAVTFFRTSPGPALVLESENDPSNAIDVTISRTGGVDELELEGNFTLQLGSRVSTSLSFDSPAVFIQRALEALPTVHLVHVDEQALLTSEDAEVFNAWTVTFVRPAGDIPLLKALVLNSTVPEVRVEISEITKGQGVAAVQRVITSARHQNMVLALRSTAVMGPVEGSFKLALDLRSLGGSRVVSNVVDHAAVATIAEERVHSARGSRPGDSIESVVNAMLQKASQGLEAHFESFDSTAMYVSVSRNDQICEHDCKLFSEEYPAGPLCTFDSASNADGAFTWFIEFHNAPSSLPLLEIEESHLVAVDTPDLYIGLLQARKASPVPEVAANQVSGSLALDGITFTHAADTDITLPQILSFASGPDLEAGLVLYLIDLGRAASGLPFPIDVNGSLLEGQGVHVDSALKFPWSRVKSEPELQLDVETTGVSWVEYMARNEIRFQGTVPELNDVLQQSVKGLRVSGHRGWHGRALINFEATALTSDDELGLHESVLVDVAPRTPEVRLQLASSVRSLREDLDIYVFGSKPGQIEAIVFGDEDIPLRLSVQVSVGFVWILPEYRLLHRSIAEAKERPAWSQPESSLVFKGTLTEVRSALAHLQYRSATLGVTELKLDISADLTQGLGHNSSLAEIPAISRTVFLNVRPLDQPLLFVNGTLHRDISVSESESVNLLSEVRLVSEEPLRETVEATLEVQRGKLTLALRDEWNGQDEVAVSEDGKMLRVRSTREGLNQQIFPYVLYRAARTHYTGEDIGILTVTSAATQRLASLTVRISITETDDPLQIVSQSPTEPLRILEDQPLPLEGLFHITDVDQVPQGELRDENITLELRTFARHVDMQQAIRTTADGGVLNGHFKVSIDLTPWGGTVVESERIAANAVPSITSERTTHATGTGRGESVEAKINALLAQAQNGSILTEQITVSVSQTDEVCSYECKSVLAAYDSSSLLCSKSAHCDLCVGHCQGGTVHRCSSDADCDEGTGSCLFSRGECLSDGSPCSSHVSCQEAGECIASGCAANTVGGNTWTITFSKAPWDLPMLFISEERFFGATNARVACDVIINRTPARPVQESNRLGGSFRINDKVLSYNASAKEVQTVFEELADLALVRNATLHGPHAAPVPVGRSFVEIVEREGPSLEDGYVWTIRMTAAAQAFASSLIVDSALLEGLEPEASLRFVGENVTPITGAHVHIESKHGVVGVRGTGRQNAVENYSVQLADSSLLEEYLDSLVFLPDQNWNSEAGRDFASVRVEVLKDDDLEGRARAATQLVHVAAVNDGPVLHVPGQVLDENDLTADQVSGRLLSVNDYSVREGSTERIAGLSIRDVDAGAKAIYIELLATNGTLSLAAEVALQNFQQMNASSMSWTGSVSAINYAFQQLLFTSENMFGNGGNASVHIIATDGGHNGDDGSIGSDSVTVPLLVVANDDAPELELPVNRHAWYCREDDSLALPGLLIRYDNYPEHESVQLEAYASHGVVQVPVVFANVSMSSLPDQGLFLEGTVAAVNGALAEAIYTPNADYSSTQTQQPDEITFTLRSVRGDIVYNSASVYVEAVNDEPFLSVPGATVEYDGAGRYVTTATPTLTTAEDHSLMMPAMTVIDADGDFEVIHLTFSCQYGSLRLAHTAAELSIEVSAESSTLWVSGQLGRVNKALGEAQDAGVVYTPTRDWSGIDVVIISVQDAAGSTDMVTLTIVVEAVNDAPVWQLPDPATLRVDEDGALALSTVRVLDVDVDAADPFLVRIEPVHGMVSVLNEAKSRSVVLNSTLSLVNQALSSLLFYPASHAHALDDEAEAEAIHFIADDFGSVGSGGPRTKESVLPIVNIIPWTDPPRIEVPGAVYANETTCQKSTRRSWPRRVEDVSLFDICGAIIDVAPIEALEDGDVRITGIHVQDSDLDVALTSRRLRVELTVSNGRLHVSPRGAANFVTGSDGRLVEFFGSPNECNLILDSIVYRPDLHWYGLDYLRIVAEDSTEMNSGVMGVASLRDEQMIPLHILPVQDVPQFTGELTQAYSGPAMLTTSEDQPLFLAGPHRELSLVHADGDKVEVAFIGIARHGTMSLDPDDFVEVKYLENLTQGVGAAAKGQVEVLAFTASVSTVREAIRHIIYVPEENWSGVEDITMISANLEDLTTDQVRLGDDFLGILSSRVAEATGSRGIDVVDDRYSSVVIHITVRATNDAPSVGLRSDAHSGHWICEEDAQVNLEGIIVDDVDGDAVQVTLWAEHGKPDISDLDVTSRKLFIAVDRDDSSLTLYGPVEDVNVLFEEDLISYSPSLNWFGLDIIEVVIEDQDGASASMTGSVLVSAVNDAPEIRSMTRTGANSVFTVAEGGRLHLSGPSRLLDADAESEIVEERLEQPAAGIWRSLVVRPGRVTDDEPSWRYSLASNASEPESLTALDADTFVFSAEDGTHGRELWRSDGRADADFASTMLIKDIRPGAQSANIDNLHLHDDGLVYFAADGKDWTWMLETDTCGGFLEAVPGIWLAVSKETTFDRFGSYDCPSGYHWASTAELAAVVGPATARAEARSGQMHSYYASLCGWSFDQWEGATRHRFMLADSYETSVFLDARQEAGSPGQLAPEVLAGGVLDETVFAGTICMADAADGTPCSRSLGCFKDAGRELWATDGTAEGTKRVVDVLPGGDGSHPSDLVSFDGDLFFAAWTELYGRELWRSDGTPQGTRMVQDLWAGTGSSDPQLLTVVGSTLFFTAEDEWHGTELWVSDGDPAFTGARPSVVRTGSAGTGTYMVLDIRTGDQVGSEPADLVHLVDNFVAFAAGDGVHGRQIWVSDGSELGTGYITDIRSDRSELGCDPQDLVVYNQQLYFTAVDGAHGRELWRVGGTDESFTATRPDGTTFAVGSGSSPLGATMVADLLPGSQGSMPTHLHVFSPSEALDPALRGVDLLVFNAMDALWVLNSATSSAVPQRAFETTAADLRFTDTGFVNLRGALFFGARPPYDTLYQRTGARQVSRKQPFFLVDVDAGSDELFSLKIETELGRIVFQDGTEAAAGVSGTLEELNVLLQSVYFEAIDGTNGAGFIIATLVDSSGASTVESFDVLVTPVNSVPVLILSRTSVRVSRSGPKVVPLHIDVSVSDEIEVPTAILEVAIASDIGKLRIEPLEKVAIVSKGERDYVLEAEKDALSSVLSTLRLELDASIEAAGYGTITLILRDHGDRGEGGPLETTAQIEIEIVD